MKILIIFVQIWYVYHHDDHVCIIKILNQIVISNELYDSVDD